MAYIENPFSVGQRVVCVSDYFPKVITTDEDKSTLGKLPARHPKMGEVYCIDEILGEFLRFDAFDEDDPTHPEYGWKWWKHTQFRPVETESETLETNEIIFVTEPIEI